MKKQEWNGAGALSPAQQGGEMKSPAVIMIISLSLANVTASGCLIKLWILWSDQLSKLHLAAVCVRLVHLIVALCPALFPLFLAQKAGTDRD